jgi:hypothetical protein
MLNLLLWLFSPIKIFDKAIARNTIEIKPKEFAEIPVFDFDMEFYDTEEFVFNQQIIKNWVCFRGSYFDKNEKTIYLFNEGENNFVIKRGMVLGSVCLKRKRFVEIFKK